MNLKGKYIFFGLIALMGLIILSFSAQTKVESTNNLIVKVKQLKSSYVLGEIVPLDIEVKNQGDLDAYLFGTDVGSGYLHILISQSGDTYKKYSNGTWGDKKTKGKVLKPSEIINSTATVLSNTVPDVSGLSDTAISHFKNKQLMTAYAFPKAGDYYLKAVLIVPSEDGNIEISSDPIKIIIKEPAGADSQVWNLIKDRSDFAYFIQNGELVDFKSPEKEAKFQQGVESIINKHPDSFYAESLKASLEKFRASEEKRKAFEEKIKGGKPD